MFSFEELCRLIQVVAETGVAAVEMEREGSRVRIEGIPPAPTGSPLAAAPPLPPQLAAMVDPGSGPTPGGGSPAAAGEKAETDEGERLSYVTSPIVGTFYRAPNPDAAPYVEVGDLVQKGQVLCIVEAMKLMNEIESDVTGTVVRILSESAQPVEFGERLFAIRPA